jgi:hypothetical protein
VWKQLGFFFVWVLTNFQSLQVGYVYLTLGCLLMTGHFLNKSANCSAKSKPVLGRYKVVTLSYGLLAHIDCNWSCCQRTNQLGMTWDNTNLVPVPAWLGLEVIRVSYQGYIGLNTKYMMWTHIKSQLVRTGLTVWLWYHWRCWFTPVVPCLHIGFFSKQFWFGITCPLSSHRKEMYTLDGFLPLSIQVFWSVAGWRFFIDVLTWHGHNQGLLKALL